MAVLLLVVIAVVALSGECASRTARASSPDVTLSTHVALVVDDRVSVAAPMWAAAVAEASAIWAPYGVGIHERSTALLDCAGEDITEVLVTIVPAAKAAAIVASSAATRDVATPLGLTGFDEDARPIPSIVLFQTSIIRVASYVVRLGVPLRRWPARAQDEVVARLIGRTLAHELGHFMLRLQAHTTSGLMRAFHTLEELSNPDRTAFGLAPVDVGRLRNTRVALAAQH